MTKRLLSAAVLCTAFLAAPLTAFAHMPPPFVGGQPVPTLAPVVKRVSPAVVNVSTRGHVNVQANPFFNDPFFQQFFGNQIPQQQQRQQQFQSLGSGVIVDADNGYILTNNHVVEHADQITVTLFDNRSFKAKVVGRDPDTDIAVLQIKADNLTALPLGDSDKLEVGDFVMAIGNPFGLNHTVTAGIVSAKGRAGIEDGKFEDFIQIDASINPGNSGGALVDLNGNLVGINTAILSRSGGNIGIGFAIPVNMAKNVMDQLIKYGKVDRGQLGVEIQDLTPDLAKALKIGQTEGALVNQVVPGSAAEKAGIKVNDVIVSVDGKPVKGGGDLRNYVGLLRVGTPVTLGIIRNGESMTVKAAIGKPESESVSNEDHPELRGLAVANMDSRSPLYGQVKGVLITDVERDSDAYAVGLRPGDVITAVNREPVSDVTEFRKALGKTKGAVALRVRRDDNSFYVVLGE